MNNFTLDAESKCLHLYDTEGWCSSRSLYIVNQQAYKENITLLFLEDGSVAAVTLWQLPSMSMFKEREGQRFLHFLKAERVKGALIRHAQQFQIAQTQFESFGLMNMEGMKFACEVILGRKGFSRFSPEVIDFSELSQKIQELTTIYEGEPVVFSRKTFIVRILAVEATIPHWVAMELTCADLAAPKLLIMGLHISGRRVDIDFQSILAVHPNLNIYVHDFSLQRSENGCSFFALHCAKRLQNIEKYLPDGVDLFRYLESNRKPYDYGQYYCVNRLYACSVPLALMLPAQTRALWDGHFSPTGHSIYSQYNDTEANLPLNKKGQNFLDILEQHKAVIPTGEGFVAVKEQNYLIEDFRHKVTQYHQKYFKAFYSQMPKKLESELDNIVSAVRAARGSETFIGLPEAWGGDGLDWNSSISVADVNLDEDDGDLPEATIDAFNFFPEADDNASWMGW